MTPRQRMITAIRHGIPDRVPVSPDFSNMIPCRRTEKPFWSTYALEEPPLWKAFLDAVKFFGVDGWFGCYGVAPSCTLKNAHPPENRWIEQSEERWLQETIIHTAKGDLRTRTLYPVDSPPETIERLIKDPDIDLPKIYTLWDFDLVDTSRFEQQRREIGELGALCTYLGTPGFNAWYGLFEGGLEVLTYLHHDRPALLEELRQRHHDYIIRQIPVHLACRPDYILTGGSGSITMSSPALWRQYALPTLKEIARLARQADVPTMVHSCGRERYLVEVCAAETDVDCINPLEIPPMGDCDLAEIKRLFGRKISLMGNLHTTNVMLRGTPEQVGEAARRAMDDAAEGGGFLLSTGDQCPRDTPDGNIFALVEAVEKYGYY